MTDRSRLSHAYGSAEDIPTLSDRTALEPEPEPWNDLWSALCHQGSVYSASFAALPWLADTASSDDREQAVSALTLAGAIVAGAEQPHGVGEVRTKHAAEVETLLAAVDRHLRTASDRTTYIHLLETMLGLEGVARWSEALAWGLGNEEYEVDCPGAGRACSSSSASEDYALSEDDVETRPLRPADPADLDDIGRRLHDLALSDGQGGVAHALTYVFGHATCPDCDRLLRRRPGQRRLANSAVDNGSRWPRRLSSRPSDPSPRACPRPAGSTSHRRKRSFPYR